MKANDVIVAIGGHAVSGPAGRRRRDPPLRPGDKVDVTVERDGAAGDAVTSTLGARPDSVG